MRKFNMNRYANYLTECKKAFDVLEYLLNFFSTKAGKILILATTTETCSIIRKFVETIIPYKIVKEYHTKASKEDRETALTDAEIICSTPKSAGTGTDIFGLRVVINTEAYSSKVTANQVAGRIREYSPTDNTYYVELVDKGFSSVYKMYTRRLPVFKRKCLKISTLDFDKIKE